MGEEKSGLGQVNARVTVTSAAVPSETQVWRGFSRHVRDADLSTSAQRWVRNSRRLQ